MLQTICELMLKNHILCYFIELNFSKFQNALSFVRRIGPLLVRHRLNLINIAERFESEFFRRVLTLLEEAGVVFSSIFVGGMYRQYFEVGERCDQLPCF
jgi:hypothetical protein